MLGPGQIDSLTLAFAVVAAARAGARRSIAAFLDRARADVAAICGIDSGDALSTATRFDLGWAYGGGAALFWNARFAAARVGDRRGWLRVEGEYGGSPLQLFAVRLTSNRESLRALRSARSAVRASNGNALLFASGLPERIGFADLGLTEVALGGGSCVAARGFSATLLGPEPGIDGAILRAELQTARA